MLPDFELFGKTIGTYGLCSIIGIVLCVCVATYAGKRYRLSFDDILLLTLSICGGLLLGGHLLYALTQQEQLRTVVQAIGKAPFQAILRTLASCFGGMVFYGGFLGGIAGAWLFGKYYRPLTSAIALDLYALVIPLFHAFGRIGCFWEDAATANPGKAVYNFHTTPWCHNFLRCRVFPYSWWKRAVTLLFSVFYCYCGLAAKRKRNCCLCICLFIHLCVSRWNSFAATPCAVSFGAFQPPNGLALSYFALLYCIICCATSGANSVLPKKVGPYSSLRLYGLFAQ